tara:strand:+ start:1181 stop:1699 length:519 start_codon:yes stop_codon:yes gene_type:complete
MPHYTTWGGTSYDVVQYPGPPDEYWATFHSADDLYRESPVVTWSQYSASNVPSGLSERLTGTFWDNSSLARPDAFMLMADTYFASPTETQFMRWDVSWNGDAGDVSGPSGQTWTIADLTGVGTNAYSTVQSFYFQVDFTPPTVPEPSTALLLTIALAASVMCRSLRRILRFS